METIGFDEATGKKIVYVKRENKALKIGLMLLGLLLLLAFILFIAGFISSMGMNTSTPFYDPQIIDDAKAWITGAETPEAINELTKKEG